MCSDQLRKWTSTESQKAALELLSALEMTVRSFGWEVDLIKTSVKNYGSSEKTYLDISYALNINISRPDEASHGSRSSVK